MFHGDEVVWLPVLREPKLKAGEVPRRTAESERVTWFNAAQKVAIASVQNRLENYKKLGNRSDKRESAGSSSSGGGEGSFR